MNEVVIIPTLNPSNRLLSVVGDLQREGFSRFIVIDDGSAPEYAHVFTVLEQRGVFVVHHPKNLGKGSALKTGFCWVRGLYPDAEAVVTCDGDGQHAPADVRRVCEAGRSFPKALVLGTRNFAQSNVPARSRFGNAFSSLYFKMDTGHTCADTQTGLRRIPVQLLHMAMTTPGARYDFEMNFLTRVAKEGVGVEAVPIQTIYEGNNDVSHFRAIADSALIYRQFIRFAASSLTCSAVDLGVFALVVALLGWPMGVLVAFATVVARLCSGILNFTLNRSWSFSATGVRHALARTQALRYGVLYVGIMLASMSLVTALSFVPVPLVIVKVFVDSALFVLSYIVQRNWVFREKTVVKAEGGVVYETCNAHKLSA